MRAAVVVLLGLLLCSGAAAKGPNPALFAYDAARPLDVRLGQRDVYGGVVRQYMTFDAGYTERLNAIYTYPEGDGPWPVVLFSPGSGGDESDQLIDANGLVRLGIASLTVATPFPLVTCSARTDIRTYANYVVSRRRALDLIPRLEKADAARMAAVGFSFGSAITGTLVGVDHRLKAAVMQSGRAHHSSAVSRSCTHLGKRRLADYVSELSVVDPVKYVSTAAPTALLFQNGTRDGGSPRRDVAAYVRAASAPKEQRWYRAGHELTAGATRYRNGWLVRQLGVVKDVAAAPPVRTIEVGEQPFSIGYGRGAAWIANYGDGTVARVDGVTEEVVARIDVGGKPWGVAVDGDDVWVGNFANGTITRIDARSNRVAARVHVGSQPVGVAARDGIAFAADFETGAVARIEADRVALSRKVPGSHEGALLSGSALWVPSEEGRLARLDPRTLRITKTLRVGNDPDYVQACGGALWVSNYRSSVLWKVDPKRIRVVGRSQVARGGQGMACVDGRLWLANYDRDTVTQLDTRGRPLRSFRTGLSPRGVVFGANSVWVANSRARTVTRVVLGQHPLRVDNGTTSSRN